MSSSVWCSRLFKACLIFLITLFHRCILSPPLLIVCSLILPLIREIPPTSGGLSSLRQLLSSEVALFAEQFVLGRYPGLLAVPQAFPQPASEPVGLLGHRSLPQAPRYAPSQ